MWAAVDVREHLEVMVEGSLGDQVICGRRKGGQLSRPSASIAHRSTPLSRPAHPARLYQTLKMPNSQCAKQFSNAILNNLASNSLLNAGGRLGKAGSAGAAVGMGARVREKARIASTVVGSCGWRGEEEERTAR